MSSELKIENPTIILTGLNCILKCLEEMLKNIQNEKKKLQSLEQDVNDTKAVVIQRQKRLQIEKYKNLESKNEKCKKIEGNFQKVKLQIEKLNNYQLEIEDMNRTVLNESRICEDLFNESKRVVQKIELVIDKIFELK